MADTYESSHGPGLRTPGVPDSAVGRALSVLRGRVERAVVPAAFVALSVALVGVGTLVVLGMTALLPANPAVALLVMGGMLGVGASAPVLARSSLVRLHERRD